MGKANTRTSTKPELRLRSAVHRRGLRFRKDHPIRLLGGRPVRPDLVFTAAKVAVFVDGCFWHCCPLHFVMPKSNPGYWEPKLKSNVRRDRLVDEQLTAAGWEVLRFWEHENPDAAADLVRRVWQKRRTG